MVRWLCLAGLVVTHGRRTHQLRSLVCFLAMGGREGRRKRESFYIIYKSIILINELPSTGPNLLNVHHPFHTPNTWALERHSRFKV